MWSNDEPLKLNKFGIPEPISKKIIYPDILLIPLVAYDDSLNRLGYGGGFYKISGYIIFLEIGSGIPNLFNFNGSSFDHIKKFI
jgi:hypothetical protein